ncbi:sugar phosphate isomerase/epimerase and 4-hydroxyphenylpyruvate domain-containing protein [Streptomyces sp. NBC_00448]|uniref:sugar phosphate isomerase/epimerase and 4-hydroxyphenylpyruvate domain-containing protein n=1 Tax=Streptomyces sp. NBC_00448 TaxID=2903652 RepID=UPI002E1ED085
MLVEAPGSLFARQPGEYVATYKPAMVGGTVALTATVPGATVARRLTDAVCINQIVHSCDRSGTMRRTLATVCLSGTLPAKLAAAAAAGFDAVELFEPDLVSTPLGPAQVRERCADLGLGIDLYQPFRDAEGLTPPVFERVLHRLDAKLAVMRQLGTDLLLVCSNVGRDSIADDSLIAEQLVRMADRAQQAGVRLAYEALAWGHHVNTVDHAWRIVKSCDHPALGLCLDSFHILARGTDPALLASVPGEKMFFLQLADAPHIGVDMLQWSRHWRSFPGQGDFDLTGFMTRVLEAGYRGPWSLEVFNDVFRQADTTSTAVDAMRSLLALEDQVRPGTLPAAAPPHEVCFAELAAADPEPLVGLMRGLGFTRAGRHRDKPVDLWERGRARILLNTAGYRRRDGAAVAAIGLETPQPQSLAARAEALKVPAALRRQAPGESEVPCVEAPDGTQIFLCTTDRSDLGSWIADFPPPRHSAPSTDASAAAGESPPQIIGIDHLALTQPWHRFDEAVLFHRAVLGLAVHPQFDLADPHGLFRSRAMTSAGRREQQGVRIALNVAPAPDQHVAADQHVALACRDVRAAVRDARARGVVFLRIPENYYADLAARFDLDEAVLGELRDLRLLYDRDEGGELLHCYTASVGRVCIELLERVSDYRGFGAVNAPVRLAVQHTG